MAVGASKIFGGLVCAFLLTIASTASANPAGHGQDRDKDRHGREDQPVRQQLIRITTENGFVEIDSLIVFTNVDEVVAALTEAGVRRVDEDRVDLAELPILGGLFGGSRETEEPREPIRIGNVHLIGPTLAIDLATPPSVNLATDAVQPIEDPYRLRYGRSLGQEIREILAARPAPGAEIAHALRGSEFAIDKIRVLNGKYGYSMPASAFGSVAGLRGISAEGGVKQLSPEQIKEIKELFGTPAGDAYLDRTELTLVIRPTVLEDYYDR
ncbi:MAG: hypothetical protein BroJett029_09740 [Alphaproteobacteria bacterium]|nr:MAG: hypothetical protein BroJett029_09740 [Alphaproteobacteria bacterium]